MNKLFITICLIVVCVCSSCARKRVILRTDVDLTSFEFVNGTFADLDREAALMKSSGKKAILMVFTSDVWDIDLNYSYGTYDSVKEIESIVTEISTAEDISSSLIGGIEAGVWFVFSDGRGYGYAVDFRDGTAYLTDTERAHRASDELNQLANNLESDGPEEEEKSYPHPYER